MLSVHHSSSMGIDQNSKVHQTGTNPLIHLNTFSSRFGFTASPDLLWSSTGASETLSSRAESEEWMGTASTNSDSISQSRMEIMSLKHLLGSVSSFPMPSHEDTPQLDRVELTQTDTLNPSSSRVGIKSTAVKMLKLNTSRRCEPANNTTHGVRGRAKPTKSPKPCAVEENPNWCENAAITISVETSVSSASVINTNTTPFTNKQHSASDSSNSPSVCSGCYGAIEDKFYLSVGSNQQWHTRCLQCKCCGLNLQWERSCFFRNEEVFCKFHYEKMFQCLHCGERLREGESIHRVSQHFSCHKNCLACAVCRRPLETGDLYVLKNLCIYCVLHGDSGALQQANQPTDMPAVECRMSSSLCDSVTVDGGGIASTANGLSDHSHQHHHHHHSHHLPGQYTRVEDTTNSRASGVLTPLNKRGRGRRKRGYASLRCSQSLEVVEDSNDCFIPWQAVPQSANELVVAGASNNSCTLGDHGLRTQLPALDFSALETIVCQSTPESLQFVDVRPTHPNSPSSNSSVGAEMKTALLNCLVDNCCEAEQRGKSSQGIRSPHSSCGSLEAFSSETMGSPTVVDGESLAAGTFHSSMGMDVREKGSGKTKRIRTSFKHQQLKIMKSYFEICRNPASKDLKQLSQKTGLSKRVLQVWFQNSRAKYRRTLSSQLASQSRTESTSIERKVRASGELAVRRALRSSSVTRSGRESAPTSAIPVEQQANEFQYFPEQPEFLCPQFPSVFDDATLSAREDGPPGNSDPIFGSISFQENDCSLQRLFSSNSI
ncbi:unnamed protein product [Calicophoron daubneyi]|uniref:Uncharacterized protein n=1 Tax=Calicophoron daubneyi TaxID=300641 RepID=A0AAV2T2L2_CALDB